MRRSKHTLYSAAFAAGSLVGLSLTSIATAAPTVMPTLNATAASLSPAAEAALPPGPSLPGGAAPDGNANRIRYDGHVLERVAATVEPGKGWKGSPGPSHRPSTQVDTPSGTTAGTNTYFNWSGYMVNNYGFTGAQMFWNEPTLSATADNRQVVIWPGVGSGAKGNQLIQAGTYATSSSTGTSYGWWYEVYPDNPYSIEIGGISLAPGDEVGVESDLDAQVTDRGNHFIEATFFFMNETTNEFAQIGPIVYGGIIDSQAEDIVERPTLNGVSQPPEYSTLANFGSVHVRSAEYLDADWECTSAYPNTRLDMVTTNQAPAGQPSLYYYLAQSSYDDPSGCTFTTTRTPPGEQVPPSAVGPQS